MITEQQQVDSHFQTLMVNDHQQLLKILGKRLMESLTVEGICWPMPGPMSYPTKNEKKEEDTVIGANRLQNNTKGNKYNSQDCLDAV